MRNTKRFIIPVLLLVVMIFACVPDYDKIPDGPTIYEHDSSVRNEEQNGLDIKIKEFQWRYNKELDRLEIDGIAVNHAPQDYQAVRMICEVFDQTGHMIEQSIDFLNPAFIAASGGTAKFNLFVSRGKWVKNVRLKYHFEIRY